MIIYNNLQTTRSAKYTPPGHYIKCFHNSEHILALHNHFPRACLGDNCPQNWETFANKDFQVDAGEEISAMSWAIYNTTGKT